MMQGEGSRWFPSQYFRFANRKDFMADNQPANGGTFLSPTLSEGLARMLRHEVGDFLQKVYATVAILQERLPRESIMERDTLARLRKRAEECRSLLDTVQDFLCSMRLASEPVNLANVAAAIATAWQDRFPTFEIVTASSGSSFVQGDPDRLVQLGNILMANACEAARSRVTWKTSAEGGTVSWTVTDDGPGVTAEQLERMFTPFVTTRVGHANLGLALAQKIAVLHGGNITAEEIPGGGLQVTVVFASDGL
jgi:signal transduction histidine kinase